MENQNEDHRKWTLLDLPVYTLRILLSFLDATTLYLLSQTCTYLRDFVEDPTFWKYIDARDHPNTSIKLLYCTERIHEKTTHIFLGFKSGHGKIPPYLFDKIKPFQNLRILSVEFQKLKGLGITLKDFPSHLEELSLKGTILKESDGFFQHSSTNMTKLKVLILDNCAWLTCSFLISVAKYENLEIISVVNCPRIHLHTVPYLNVAKYGLKKLKIFDCRFTGIGAELLHTFYSKDTIQKLYFQSLNCAQADYKVHFPGNSKVHLPSESYVDLQISDFSLLQYHGVTVPSDYKEKICDSILYKDPYPDCTCGHKEYHEEGPVLDCEISEDDIPISYVTKFICEKHLMDMKNLPDTFKEFCLSQRNLSQGSDLSDFEESSDADSSGDEFSCCTVGATSKMVILQNLNDPIRRQEFFIPRTSSKISGRQMNIFIVNPLGDRENALANFENYEVNNRPNENAEVIDEGRENGTNENRENENRHNVTVNGENEVHENATNENRDNETRQNVEDESRENGRNENRENQGRQDTNNANERVTDRSENRANIIDITTFLNMPGTSRGIFENCINENTENSRMEVERQQNEDDDQDTDNSKPNSKASAENSKGCDDNNIADTSVRHQRQNSSNGILTSSLRAHIQRDPSTSRDYVVIERQVLAPAPGRSFDEPSCSGLNQNRAAKSSAQTKNNTSNSTKRKSLKRKNEHDKDDKTNKRRVKIILVNEAAENPAASSSDQLRRLSCNVERPDESSSSSSCSPRRNKDRDDNSSTTRKRPRCSLLLPDGLVRNAERIETHNASSAEEHRDRERVTGIVRPSDVEPVITGDRVSDCPEGRGNAASEGRTGVAPEHQSAVTSEAGNGTRTERTGAAPSNREGEGNERNVGEEDVNVSGPEYHRDASGNPFRVIRLRRTVGPEQRRINIRHVFPLPPQQNLPPEGARLRYRYPANEYKISLRCLSLRGYKRITNTTLYYIKHLNLELIDLTYTSVTKEGIENFLVENPNCRIIHQNYCRCKPKNPF